MATQNKNLRELQTMPELLKVEEIQQVLRCGKSSAYAIAKRHRVPDIGGLVRVPRAVVERMVRGEQA